MRSTPSLDSRSRRSQSDDRGSAVVEFSMIAVLLSAIFFVVLQVGIYLYQRSVIASSALAAARYTANANVGIAEGGPRAVQLIEQSLSRSATDGITCTATEQIGEGGLRLVVIECAGSVPSIVTALGSLLPIEATASAIEEGQ